MKISTQKGFIVPLIGGIVALLIAGGIYWVWHNKSDDNYQLGGPKDVASLTGMTSTTTGSDSIQATSTQATSTQATSGWKTYTNSGFSINYPSDLNVYTSGNQELNANGLSSLIVGIAQSTTSDSALSISIIRNGVVNADTYASQLLGLSDNLSASIKAQQEKKVSIDGVSAIVIELISVRDNKVSGTHVIFQKGNTRYELIGAGDYATGPILEQFYNSFKFTN